jgi:hypothetical protein
MYWLLGRRSKLSLENKLLLYKCEFKPVWTYGIKLWGCSKSFHTQIIQRLQSKILRSMTNSPWYVSNFTLHNDLHVPFVATDINRSNLPYHQRLVGHQNALINALTTPRTFARRLKTVADRSIPHCSERLTLCPLSPTYGFRRSVIDG